MCQYTRLALASDKAHLISGCAFHRQQVGYRKIKFCKGWNDSLMNLVGFYREFANRIPFAAYLHRLDRHANTAVIRESNACGLAFRSIIQLKTAGQHDGEETKGVFELDQFLHLHVCRRRRRSDKPERRRAIRLLCADLGLRGTRLRVYKPACRVLPQRDLKAVWDGPNEKVGSINFFFKNLRKRCRNSFRLGLIAVPELLNAMAKPARAFFINILQLADALHDTARANAIHDCLFFINRFCRLGFRH